MSVSEGFGVPDSALHEIVIANTLREAKRPESRILKDLEQNGYDPDTVFAIKLALEEALTNAVKHGNGNDASKQIVVRYHISPARVLIMVRDEGPGFDLQAVPDPTADENLERPNGRGIMLMHAYMTSIHFNERGNEVWMLKENPGNQAQVAAGREGQS